MPFWQLPSTELMFFRELSTLMLRLKAPHFLKQMGLVPWLVLTDVFPCWILAYCCCCSIASTTAISVPGCSEVPGVHPHSLPSPQWSPTPVYHHQLPQCLPSYEAPREYGEQHWTPWRLLQSFAADPLPSWGPNLCSHPCFPSFTQVFIHSSIFLLMSGLPCFRNSQNEKFFRSPRTYSKLSLVYTVILR